MSRSFGATRFTTLPPIAISPSVISSSPAIMRSSVDLPQPDGPTRTQNSPSAMATSTPRITWVEPKRFLTPRMSTAAMRSALLSLPGAGRDHVIGPAGADPGRDIARGLLAQLAFGLDREERRVRGQDDPRVLEQRRAGGHRL